MMEVCSIRFPHSDISGSMDICSSPKLFAAYHVFHRLLVPRHPPCALISLTFWFIALNHRAVFTRVIFRYLVVYCFGYDFFFASPAFLPLRQILNHITSDVLIFFHIIDYSICSFQGTWHIRLIHNVLLLNRMSVGLSGLEPPTSRLSGVRSNRLSYKPSFALFSLNYHE